MKKHNRKIFQSVLIAAFLVSSVFVVFDCSAATLDLGMNFAQTAGLGTTDIRITIAAIIRIFLGLLGIIGVALVIYGGYLYMTSQGNAEKTLRARQLLIAAAIGLVIIFSAFAITQFILNGLITATGGTGGGGTGGGGGGGIDPMAICPDPNLASAGPFICEVTPQGPVASLVTISGGKFGSYNAATSKVRFIGTQTDVIAAIASCNGNPSWNNNQIVVEVPAGLQTINNPYDIVVETANGSSVDKITAPKNPGIPNYRFILTAGTPGPGIACILPNLGKENTAVTVYGKRFGATKGTSNLSFTENKIATTSSWADEQINASVPSGALSGDANVTVNSVASNGSYFYVSCAAASECSTGCCYYNTYCADANRCLPGVGEKCANADPACTTGQCQTGTECRADFNCTCQLVTGPRGPVLPTIEFVDPDNGAVGNFVTIFGVGFGTQVGHVYFLGHAGAEDDKEAFKPTICSQTTGWNDTQVIVKVPEGAVSGPIRIINSTNNFEDDTANNRGYLMNFTINNIIRPGICSLAPERGTYNTSITLSGINFGESTGDVYFSAVEGGNKGNWTWGLNEISAVTTPNLQPDLVKVQVKSSGEYSNPVIYTVNQSADAPFIDYIDPGQGPVGQYITIFGKNFGSKTGLAKVTFIDPVSNNAIDDPSLIFDFPADCGDPPWYNKSIIVKVPAGINTGTAKVFITDSNGANSNQSDFTVCTAGLGSCQLTPGICKISPNNGPAVTTTGIEIIGERFGTFDTTAAQKTKAIFWNNQDAQNISGSWTDKKIGLANSQVISVPKDATSGPLYITDKNGTKSNTVDFTVADCLKVPATVANHGCEINTTCCELDSVCKPAEQCKIASPTLSTYQWNFYTGQNIPGPGLPQVVEDSLCATSTQSPSPFLNSDNNCKNTLISARFTTLMDGATINRNNITIYNCGAGDTYAEANCQQITNWNTSPPRIFATTYTIANNTIPATGFDLVPPSDLIVNNWYKITLVSGAAGIHSDSGIWLDGDFDNTAGGDYSWHFKVRNTTDACTLAKVVVTPDHAKMTNISETREYNAWSMAANCNLLNPAAYDWSWTSKKSDGTSGTNIATISNNKNNWPPIFGGPPDYVITGYGDNKVDPMQTATAVSQGVTYIGATPYEGDTALNISDTNNKLEVDLNVPIIIDIYPKDGLVRAELNTALTITGSNFGDAQGTSLVYVGGARAQTVSCGVPWTDNQIMVYIPKPQSIVSENYKAILTPTGPGATDNSVLTYYNFNEASKALAADAGSLKFDGEITNGDKSQGMEGLALSLSGTDSFLKIPGKYNIPSGSIEMWFKANEINKIQELFSVSEGSNNGPRFEIVIGSQNNIFLRQGNTTWGDIYSINSPNGQITNNKWYHVVATVADGIGKIYLNGYLVSTGAATKFLGDITNQNEINLGMLKRNTAEAFFGGLIDNFAIYNRALSYEEVQTHYGVNPAGGLVGLWNFDETGSTALDQSGNGNDANLFNITPGGELPKREAGIFGQAITLNGTSQGLKIAPSDAFHFTKNISILVWYKTDNLSQPINLISNFSSDKSAWRMIINGMYIRRAGTGDANWALSNIGLVANQWNLVAATYDGNVIKQYNNGVLVKEYAVTGMPDLVNYNFNRSICIGATNSTDSCVGPFFKGSLDEIAVYNRTLDAVQISNYYGASFPAEVKVITGGGSAIAADKFNLSQNIYPFLCSLNPDYGLNNTAVFMGGENFGDTNSVEIGGQSYQIGSYTKFGDLFLTPANLSFWSNGSINITNPKKPEDGNIFAVRVRINPASGPYKDNNFNGIYDTADTFPAGYSAPTAAPLDSNSQNFYMAPVITSINPPQGPVKQWVTITGYNFGDIPGTVYFFDSQTAAITPCETYWRDRQIIVAVPDLAISGGVYVRTARNLGSNIVQFNVNNDPLGAGICSVTNNNPLSANYNDYTGVASDPILVKGSRFFVRGANDNLVFTQPTNINAGIAEWNNSQTSVNQFIRAVVPDGAKAGLVKVVQRMQVGKKCAGFSIGSFCPSNQFDFIYKDIPSNSVYFNISSFVNACDSDADCPCGDSYSTCDLATHTCNPKITDFTDRGPIGSWVTLYGCYFGCNTGTVKFTNNKQGITIANADCGNTWRCSYNNQQDEVVIEVPNITTPTDNTDDAVSGALELITANGLNDYTTPDIFTVTNIPQPNLCLLSPNFGKVTTPLDLFGSQFGDTRTSTDYVVFTENKKLAESDYRNIPTDVSCTGDGWSDKKICGKVPLNSSTGLVKVVKNNVASNGLIYNLTTQCTAAQPECGASCCNAGTYCTERLMTGKGLTFSGATTKQYACSANNSIVCDPQYNIGQDCSVGTYRCSLDATQVCIPGQDAGGCGPGVNRCTDDNTKTCTNPGTISTGCNNLVCDKHTATSCTTEGQSGCASSWVCSGDANKTCPAHGNSDTPYPSNCNKYVCNINSTNECSDRSGLPYTKCGDPACNDAAKTPCSSTDANANGGQGTVYNNCGVPVCNNDHNVECTKTTEQTPGVTCADNSSQACKDLTQTNAAATCNRYKCSGNLQGCFPTFNNAIQGLANGSSSLSFNDNQPANQFINDQTNWAIIMWVKPSSTMALNSYQSLYSEYSGSTSFYNLYLYKSAAGISLNTMHRNPNSSTGNFYYPSGLLLVPDQWNFVAEWSTEPCAGAICKTYFIVNGQVAGPIDTHRSRRGTGITVWPSLRQFINGPSGAFLGEVDEITILKDSDSAVQPNLTLDLINKYYNNGDGYYGSSSDDLLWDGYHVQRDVGNPNALIDYSSRNLNLSFGGVSSIYPTWQLHDGKVYPPDDCSVINQGRCNVWSACSCATTGVSVGCVDKSTYGQCKCNGGGAASDGFKCQTVDCGGCNTGDVCKVWRTCDCDAGQTCQGKTCECPAGDTCTKKTCECGEGQTCENKACQCPGAGNTCRLTPCQCPSTDGPNNRCVEQNFDDPCAGGASCVNFSLNNQSLNNFSIETWFKSNSKGTFLALTAGNFGPAIGIDSNGKLSAIIADNGTIKRTVATTETVNDNSWHLGTLTFDGREIKIYLDGQEKLTDALVYNFSKTASGGNIGTGTKTTSHFGRYTGSLDELRLYNRVLNADEITVHYNTGKGVQGQTETGLIAGWHMDEPSGSTYLDYSGNSHNATAQNTAPLSVSGKVSYPTLGCSDMDCPIFCTGNQMCCSTACVNNLCPDALGLGPKIISTVPSDATGEFCRNGIVSITFDQKLNTSTLNDYVNIYDCGQRELTLPGWLPNTISQAVATVITSIWDGMQVRYGLAQASNPVYNCDKLDVDIKNEIIGAGSQVTVSPKGNSLLNINSKYKVQIIGGASGIRDINGRRLAGTSLAYVKPDGDNYYFEFFTGGNPNDLKSGVCAVENIRITLYNNSEDNSGRVLGDVVNNIKIANDSFACAAEGCPDDKSPLPGNQHRYVAQALSNNQLIKANFIWSRSDLIDPQRILEIFGSNDFYPDADRYGNSPATVSDLSEIYNTIATVQKAAGKLSVQAQAIVGEVKQSSLDVLVFLCQNPWPALGSAFPNYYDLNPYNFEFIYCRDKGSANSTTDDLPAAGVIKVK